eukprot:CAMPEP_0197865532 /NCGR_PEP_ID=MMETSP1438-20131217/43722_1 /TAXON_ID=1461541 /ORGANISM="Pterosperma sp., Strain CCMP1384" /LENGTH=452 /DNA_ID=CAMNT_0043484017 /DNA_START=352 /DNA_END=1710 /DNA_ORIENTATION=+
MDQISLTAAQRSCSANYYNYVGALKHGARTTSALHKFESRSFTSSVQTALRADLASTTQLAEQIGTFACAQPASQLQQYRWKSSSQRKGNAKSHRPEGVFRRRRDSKVQRSEQYSRMAQPQNTSASSRVEFQPTSEHNPSIAPPQHHEGTWDPPAMGDASAPRAVVPRRADEEPPVATPLSVPAAHLTPAETMKLLVKTGHAHGDRSNTDIILSSTMGGAYLSFGAMMMLHVAGGSPELAAAAPGVHSLIGGMVFPIGLSLITLTKADLLTSNMMLTALPFLTHRERAATNISSMLRVNGLSLLGNLAGSAAMAGIAASAIVTSPAVCTFAANLAVKKCSYSLSTVFLKAVTCNWLVNLAVYNAATSTTTGGKILGLWLPIMTFVTLGLEHSVANMFLIPLGMLAGADVSMVDMWMNNLIPVIAGNAVGATVMVSMVHWRMMLKGATGGRLF